ncbi:MAG: biotin--[acetyl-CoA-carboxylase] ligase [Spirochaetaceae bacterium]|jgi:BirA family biotin operon repressor/biotin-[acetyl-CoA-carboxylase] ligase|nr:biotin--[acetyl-CoA-carboxylase] ligase [Spirochaetaceae bacterium]
MVLVPVRSPFDAPVYHAGVTGSTMDVAKELAERGEPDGTVIVADYQEQGRGRFADRRWLSGAGESLLFTIFFRYRDFSEIPVALTLRAGLAVSAAVDGFVAPEKTAVKWPNDILAGGKKLAGILAEAVSNTVYIGVGVNVLQERFPSGADPLARAGSIASALKDSGQVYTPLGDGTRFLLLEKILAELDGELRNEACARDWRARLEDRLFMRGQEVDFAPGGRGTEDVVRGIVTGITDGGGLVLQTAAGEKTFISGEIRL